MIISAKDCWGKAQGEHYAYFDETVSAAIKRERKNLAAEVYAFLLARHAEIRSGGEQVLRGVQADFEKTIATFNEGSRVATAEVLAKIYDYTAFSRKHPKNWCAYKLCEKLSILTCPYCNLAYGHTLTVDDEGIVRPTLDHYFDKATYPLFAISLGNLIASCYQCNSSLKGRKNFFIEEHLNPLTSGQEIKIGLDVDLIKARFDLREFDNASIKLEYDRTDKRTVNSVKTFYLEERYQFLIDEIRFIAKNMRKYKGLDKADPGWVEWITRGVNDANYKNVVLGKLIMDLTGEYLN